MKTIYRYICFFYYELKKPDFVLKLSRYGSVSQILDEFHHQGK